LGERRKEKTHTCIKRKMGRKEQRRKEIGKKEENKENEGRKK
jgi:hypothetical protein